MYISLIILFLLGLSVGSFLNVLIYRLENKKRKSIKGRSFCPHCKKEIKAYDLIPVLSWIILQGKCRSCKKEISIQYPLVEISTGFIFVMIGYFFLQSGQLIFINIFNLVFWLFFSGCLVTIFVYDFKHQIIPDEIIYTILIVSLIFVSINTFMDENLKYLIDHLLSGLFAGGFFYTLAAVSKGKWMGGGDIKLVAFMGLVLGWQCTLVALYIAFIVGAMVGVVSLVSGKKKIGSKIPFGPFLVFGTFAGLLFGEQSINFYVKIFL